MGAIIYILILGDNEVLLFKKRYPACQLFNLTNSEKLYQQYRLIIPNEELEDTYYHFLLENQFAMSSRNFMSRIESDRKVVKRMRMKVTTALISLENHKTEEL